MGYMRHHAIVVSSAYVNLNNARSSARKFNLNPSQIIESRVNGYKSFFIPPDGSKEGWEKK